MTMRLCIYNYLEDDKASKASASDNKLVRIFKRLNDKFFTGHQKKYYSFDMVEKFNDYKMCVVGEEITGLPGIGFVSTSIRPDLRSLTAASSDRNDANPACWLG